ncbi:dynein axonemal assembly factor 10-like [Ornithodoros turicata]|uniref:Putative wd40 repeat-containing protein n=1 Tax=Ornithodoros turicata TaxID=34597 RepID=A0A2R5LJ68_9ACAR
MSDTDIHSYIQIPLQHTVFDVKWMPHSAKFLTFGILPNGTGCVELYEMTDGSASKVAEIPHTKGVKTGSFAASSQVQRDFATGDFEGRLRIWDLEEPEKPVYAVKAHSSIINSIDGIGEAAPSIATGSKDGSVRIWDTRTTEPVAVIQPSPDQVRRDCWTVGFGNSYCTEGRHVCAGYENGEVKLFDLRNLKVSWDTNVKYGVCSLEFDQKDIYMNKLVTTGVDSQIHVFDMRTRHPEKGYAQLCQQDKHKSTVWTVKHLPQDKDVFMTANGSGFLSLWKYNYPEKRACDSSDGAVEGVTGSLSLLRETRLTTQPVVNLDWNSHMKGLFVTCALNQNVYVMFVSGLAE